MSKNKIDEAIKRGDFENLKGKGRPLKLWGDLTDRRVMTSKARPEKTPRAKLII